MLANEGRLSCCNSVQSLEREQFLLPNEKRVEQFYLNQLTSWPEVCSRVQSLQQLELKTFDLPNLTLIAQYNPERIVSTSAQLDASSLQQRKCFLCSSNQPKEQERLNVMHRYWLCVNPFPVLPQHFTISFAEHENQQILSHVMDLGKMALEWVNHVLFYNGAHCGASAPDHMHFQMVAKGYIPLQTHWTNLDKYLVKIFSPHEEENYRGIYLLEEKGVVPMFVIKGRSERCCAKMLNHLCKALPKEEDEWEPRMNVFAWKEPEWLQLVVIPRTKHRPDCYFSQDEMGFCISPGSLDMAGLMITPRREDFERMNAERIQTLLKEVAFSRENVKQCVQTLHETVFVR